MVAVRGSNALCAEDLSQELCTAGPEVFEKAGYFEETFGYSTQIEIYCCATFKGYFPPTHHRRDVSQLALIENVSSLRER